MTSTATWIAGSGGWFTAAQWSEPNPNAPPPTLNEVPNADDDVNIDGGGGLTVAYDGAAHGDDVVNTLNGSNGATLDITSGYLEVLNGGFYDAAVNLSSGATLTADAGNLVFTSGSLSGTLAGAGEITLRGSGVFTLDDVVLNVATLTIALNNDGFGATVNLNSDISYAHNFFAIDYSGNYSTLNLDGHTLTLSGSSTLDAIFNGPGVVLVTGTATEPSGEYGSNTLKGGAVLEVGAGGTVNQQQSIYLGDGATTAELLIDAGGNYNITQASNLGSRSAAIVVNNGTLDDSATGLSYLSGSFTNNNMLSIAAGATLDVQTGAATLSGTISGAGTLAFGFGEAATLDTSNVTVAGLQLSGGNGGATLTLGVDLAYAGAFSFAGQFDALALNGHTLTLTGAASTFYGNTIQGGGTVRVTGTLGIGGNATYGGYLGSGPAVTLIDAGAFNQTGSYNLNGTLTVEAGASYDIASAGNIVGAAGSIFGNDGTLTDAAAGVSAIGGGFSNTGALVIGAGANIALQAGGETLGGTISGAGALTLGFASAATLTSAAVSVATMTLNGGNGGATLTLGADVNYAGVFGFAGQFDALALNGHTLTLSGAADTLYGNLIEGPGVLKVTGTTALGGNLNVVGAAAIEDAGTLTQSGNISLNGALLVDAGATYTLSGLGNISNGAGLATLTNNGVFDDAVAGTAYIDGNFANDDGLLIASGATFQLQNGAQQLGGIISGGGTILLGYAANATLTSGALSVATFSNSGAFGTSLLTLGLDISYAGAFSTYDTLALNSHTLTLSGLDNALDGGAINGPGALKVTGAADLGGYVTVNGATIEDAGHITLSNYVTLNGTLQIDAGASLTVASPSGISGSAAVVNNGTLDDSVAGSFSLTGSFANNDDLTVGAGATLVLGGGTETLGGTLSGGGTILLGYAANATLTSSALGVATFSNSGAFGTSVLTLGQDISDANAFSTYDTLALNGHTLTLSGLDNALDGGAIDGPGALKVTGAADLGGYVSVNGATIEDAGHIALSNYVTLNGTLQIDAGAVLVVANTSSVAGSAAVVNDGTLDDSVAGSFSLTGSFANNDDLLVGAGATLALGSGTETLGGTVHGDGAILLGYGASATLTSSALVVATFSNNGAFGNSTLTLGRDISYAGQFSSYDALYLNSATLTLSGSHNAFEGGAIYGPGAVKVTGTADIGGYVNIAATTFGGATPTIEDAAAMTQSGDLNLQGALSIDAGASYTVTNHATITNSGVFTNSGTLDDRAAGVFSVQGTFNSDDDLIVESGATLALGSGTETLAGTISGAGAIVLGYAANTLLQSNAVTVATLSNAGAFGYSTLSVAGDLVYAGQFSNSATLYLNTLTLSGASNTLSGGSISGVLKVTGAADLGGGVTLQGGRLEDAGVVTQSNGVTLQDALLIDAGATYSLTNPVAVNGGGTLTNSGAFIVAGAGASFINVSFVNGGAVTIDGGASLEFTQGFVGDSAVTVQTNASVQFDQAASGVGVITLEAGSTAAFRVSDAAGQSVAFDGVGATLDIARLAFGAFAGTIAGFTGAGDTSATSDIILVRSSGLAGDHLVWSQAAGTLSVEDASDNILQTLSLAGTYLQNRFQLDDNLSTGVDQIAYDTTAPCYVRGTRIATQRGEIAVEGLKVGDLALTASGAWRPIRWLGHRAIKTARHVAPAEVWPVRIAAQAFGEGLPRRDLWVSPGHSLAFEGCLIPASRLLNGVTVAQIERDEVEYWHVELDAHDVLLAEGLPAESYLDQGNRASFANGGAFVEAHPNFAPKHWTQTCLPLALDGEAVARAKALLIARARVAGFEIVSDPAALMVVDGLAIAPMRLAPRRLGFVLPPGGREIVLQSRVFIPAQVSPTSDDARALGLSVARLQIDGEDLAFQRLDAAEGWAAPECAGARFAHRWTSGRTRLPAGARVVVIDLAGEGRYWARACETAASASGRRLG